jgi:ABC-type proline/glycine betaine transport system permease subunit
MKIRKALWKFLSIIGASPFLIAVGYCLVNWWLNAGSPILKMTFWDYLILYSFLYWPTYIIGIALILLSLRMINKKR